MLSIFNNVTCMVGSNPTLSLKRTFPPNSFRLRCHADHSSPNTQPQVKEEGSSWGGRWDWSGGFSEGKAGRRHRRTGIGLGWTMHQLLSSTWRQGLQQTEVSGKITGLGARLLVLHQFAVQLWANCSTFQRWRFFHIFERDHYTFLNHLNCVPYRKGLPTIKTLYKEYI